MLVATAGHIDHGKTTLVRALTGVETDRLPEERARGISIDLGFAYWSPEDGTTIGFVDVPGHERFVRNMLAGVGGVDFALIVVAADDGIMPQTVEHVQILDLLGLTRGIVAITKCDRAPPERIATVRSQTAELLARTGLSTAPVIEVSAQAGHGVAELGMLLRSAAAQPSSREAGGAFRLSVDRVFTVTGTGTVVTGTVLDGAVEVGTRLVVSPAGHPVRVRGLQSAGERVTRVVAGQRCALNLAGVEVADVHRGDQVLLPEMHAPTTRMEARVTVLADRETPLLHGAHVHLHLGTADLAARVLMPGQASIAAGESALARLVLERPTGAVVGDRFVLRDQSGRHSIGGGRIVDPLPPSDRRRQAERLPVTTAMERFEPDAALQALLAIPSHEVDTRRFEQAFGLTAEAAQALYRAHDAVLLGKAHTLALPVRRITSMSERIVAALGALHRDQPEVAGMTSRELRARLDRGVSSEALAALLKELAEQGRIELGGSLAKLPGHAASLTPADTALWERLAPWREERGLQPFTISDVAAELRTTEAAVKALLFRRRARGDLWRITESRYMLREQVADLAGIAERLDVGSSGGGFTAAQYRDASGLGRNFIIQLLEFFDRVGICRRKGNARTVLADYRAVLGVGPAPEPAR